MTTRRTFLFRSVPSAAALSLTAPKFVLHRPTRKQLCFECGDRYLDSELRPYIQRFSATTTSTPLLQHSVCSSDA